MTSFADIAGAGAFKLPTCADCGACHWPPRAVCRTCLSAAVAWRDAPSTGTLVAASALHHSLSRDLRDQLPLHVGTVRLDAGPLVFVFLAEPDLAAGTAVTLSPALDHAGRGIFSARPCKPG